MFKEKKRVLPARFLPPIGRFTKEEMNRATPIHSNRKLTGSGFTSNPFQACKRPENSLSYHCLKHRGFSVNLYLRATLQAILFLTTIGLFGCDSSTETADESKSPLTAVVSNDAAGLITVDKAWIRATAPLQTVSGAFMTLVNNSATAYSLVSVSFAGAGAVEIHETSMVDGKMRMRQVDQIEIPSNGSAALKPGSYHIMLIGLERAMEPGARETLALTFSDGSQKTVEAVVGNSGEQHTHE